MTNQIARKWMSKKVISIPMDYSLYQAREIMDSYQIRHLLVKDRTEQSIGILSDRDLLRAMMPDLNSNPFDGKTAGEFDSSLTVGDVMSWPAVSVDDQTSISAVIDQMLEGKFSAVIVQKPGAAHPTGILTTTDLLHLTKHLLETPDQNEFKRDTPLGAFLAL